MHLSKILNELFKRKDGGGLFEQRDFFGARDPHVIRLWREGRVPNKHHLLMCSCNNINRKQIALSVLASGGGDPIHQSATHKPAVMISVHLQFYILSPGLGCQTYSPGGWLRAY